MTHVVNGVSSQVHSHLTPFHFTLPHLHIPHLSLTLTHSPSHPTSPHPIPPSPPSPLPPPPITQPQASSIMQLLREHHVLRHVMKVPQDLRRDPNFNTHYCSLVKSLVPTRGGRQQPQQQPQTKGKGLTPASSSLSSLGTALAPPPAKPKRMKRSVTETTRSGSRVGTDNVMVELFAFFLMVVNKLAL